MIKSSLLKKKLGEGKGELGWSSRAGRGVHRFYSPCPPSSKAPIFSDEVRENRHSGGGYLVTLLYGGDHSSQGKVQGERVSTVSPEVLMRLSHSYALACSVPSHTIKRFLFFFNGRSLHRPRHICFSLKNHCCQGRNSG